MADAKTVTRDSITIVEPVPKKPLTKIISIKDDKIVIDGKSNMSTYFSYREVFFTNFNSMAKAFEAVSKVQTEAVIRGELAEGLNPDKQYRRKNRLRQDGKGTINEQPHNWIMIDFDNVSIDAQLPEKNPAASVKKLVSMLPPPFNGASCWWQYSASQGFKGKKVSLHLVFWMDVKVSDGDMRRLIDVENEVYQYETGGTLMDSCLCDSIQLHYTAAPVLMDGVDDPLKKRSGVHKGETDTAVISDSWILEKEGTENGYYRYLDRMGDDKDGFHQPILAAIASWINYHGEPKGDSLKSLIAIIRDRIDAAYVDPKRDLGTLNRYRSEDFIRTSAQRAIVKGFKQTINQKIDVDGLVSQYIYVNLGATFYDPDRDIFFTERDINNMYLRLGANASRAMLKSDGLKRVDLVESIPGDDKYTTTMGRSIYNKWAGRPIEAAKDPEDVTMLLNHLRYLVDDNEEAHQHLTSFLAHIISRPGIRIRHCIILGSSVQGIGKSYLSYMLGKVMGDKNLRSVSTSTLKEKYNGWAQDAELVVIEELMARGRMEMANHLKPIISQDIISIRKMNTDAYDTKIYCNFIAFTNHRNAMMLDETDRRYWVWYTTRGLRKTNYYDNLFDWTEKNVPAIYRWALDFDLSKFNPNRPPPRTASTELMIQLSANPLDEFVKENISQELWPFQNDLVILSDLLNVIPSKYKGASGVRIGMILEDLDAISLGKKRFPDGSRPRVWAIRNVDKYRFMSGSELADVYAKPGHHSNITTVDF